MHLFMKPFHRFLVVGTISLAGALLVAGCASSEVTRSDSPPEAPPVEATEEDWGAAVARAEAATFLLYSDAGFGGDGPYDPNGAVAFYIGNNEWISAGVGFGAPSDRPRPVIQRGLRRGAVQYDFKRHVYLDRDLQQPITLQPVTVIGRDRQMGLSLLRASGEGVTPLRLAADLPPPCTPLRLTGYG